MSTRVHDEQCRIDKGGEPKTDDTDNWKLAAIASLAALGGVNAGA